MQKRCPYMKRKYFFFDIDGTLTDNSTHKIVPSAKEAVRRLQEEGHFTAIATGRAWYKTKKFAKNIGIDNVVCCGGGGLVLKGELQSNEPLDHAAALSIIRHAEEAGIGYIVMLEDSDDVYMKDYRFLEQAGFRRELTTYHYDLHMDLQNRNILKIYLAYRAETEPEWVNELGHLRLHKEYVVFQYDAKKEGILRMMKAVNGDLSDVVVFGDDTNDLVMFDPVWTSIAMGNAVDALKEKADYVTDRNVDHGIWNACVRNGWISSAELR